MTLIRGLLAALQRFARLLWDAYVISPWLGIVRGRDCRAEDARGTTHWIRWSAGTGEPPGVFRAVRKRVTGRDCGEGVSLPVAAAGILLPIAPMLFLGMTVEPVIILIAAPWVMLAVPIGLIQYVRPRRIPLDRSPERIRDAWVAEGVCPACAYGLHPEPARPQYSRCAECGALWEKPPTRSPSP